MQNESKHETKEQPENEAPWEQVKQVVSCHAGSLTGNVLVLYEQGQKAKRVFGILIYDKKLIWDMYCKDLSISNFHEDRATVTGLGKSVDLPCYEINSKNVLQESCKIAEKHSSN